MFFAIEWEQLLFCGAREAFGDVSLCCAKGTAFVSSWSVMG